MENILLNGTQMILNPLFDTIGFDAILKESKETLLKTMLLTDKHKSIEPLFEKEFWAKFA